MGLLSTIFELFQRAPTGLPGDNEPAVTQSVVGSQPGSGMKAPASVPVVIGPNLVYPAKGFDCYAGTLSFDQLTAAVNAGYTFIMHYYGGSEGKDLTRASAIATSALGMWCGAVFEEGGANFSGDQGVSDAQRALEFAAQVGQPKGSAIYFAVDTGIGAGPAVLAYFAAVASIVRPAGYRVGAYGPGAVLAATLAAGTVDYDWLGGAMGWPGSREYIGAAMEQRLPHDVPGVTQVDDDIAMRECGLFQVSA